MAKAEDVRNEYEKITDRLFTDRKAFSDFLSFSGRFYKLPSEQAMAVFSANPGAAMVADYDTWKKFGRQVRNGEKV